MFFFGKKKEQPQAAASPLPKRKMLTYQAANLQGIGTRERQEDGFAIINALDVMEIKKNGLLFAVCDGMGGMRDGKLASETALTSIRNTFAAMDREQDMAGQLRDGIYRAAEEVKRKLEGDGGSTVVAGIIFKEKLYYASVGDSFLYLKRDSNLYRLNMEHNIRNQLYLESIRWGEMDPEPGRESEEAAALTQFLGMIGFSDVDCSVKPLPLKEGDVLLACSDGVGGVLDEEEIRNALNLISAQAMCRQMEQGIIAHAEINQDNYTAVVVKCLY